jgi:hypothetical protein
VFIPFSNAVNVRITLKWVLRKYGGMALTGFVWLRIGTSGGVV